MFTHCVGLIWHQTCRSLLPILIFLLFHTSTCNVFFNTGVVFNEFTWRLNRLLPTPFLPYLTWTELALIPVFVIGGFSSRFWNLRSGNEVYVSFISELSVLGSILLSAMAFVPNMAIDCLSMLSMYEYTVNVLLQNVLNYIHPPLLFLMVVHILVIKQQLSFTSLFHSWNMTLHSSEIFFYAYLGLTLVSGLGGWWAFQEGNWGGWWNWDPSEVLSVLILVIPCMWLHVNTMKFHTMTAHKELYLMLLLVLGFYIVLQLGFTLSAHDFGLRFTTPLLVTSIFSQGLPVVITYVFIYSSRLVCWGLAAQVVGERCLGTKSEKARQTGFIWTVLFFSVVTFMIVMWWPIASLNLPNLFQMHFSVLTFTSFLTLRILLQMGLVFWLLGTVMTSMQIRWLWLNMIFILLGGSVMAFMTPMLYVLNAWRWAYSHNWLLLMMIITYLETSWGEYDLSVLTTTVETTCSTLMQKLMMTLTTDVLHMHYFLNQDYLWIDLRLENPMTIFLLLGLGVSLIMWI